MMDHKATPKQWETDAARWLEAILELRARVELLELGAGIRDAVAKELDRNYPAKPDSSLLERVSSAINPSICADSNLYLQEARAAIREVAAWMTSNPDVYFPPALVFAVEQEAER